MSKKELIAHKLDKVPEENLDALLRFVRSLTCKRAEEPAPALMAESSLAKDWLTPEEEAAWADL